MGEKPGHHPLAASWRPETKVIDKAGMETMRVLETDCKN